MAKNKKMIMIIGAIVLVLLIMNSPRKGAQADISNAIITRTMPTTVKAGTAFVNTYTASGYGGGKWGVLVKDAIISGGCTSTAINLGWAGPDQLSDTKTITAPSVPF